jgi:hypothetical protein
MSILQHMKQSHFSHCSLSKCSVSQVICGHAGCCCFSLRSLYMNRGTEGWLVESITIVAFLQRGDVRVGVCTQDQQQHQVLMRTGMLLVIYIDITSLHAWSARVAVSLWFQCQIVATINLRPSAHEAVTLSHCSLSKCSVSQVVSVYAGYCCFSLRSLYNSGSTEGWLVESISIVALLQWCDIRVRAHTRSSAALSTNAYRYVTCHLHLHHFATRSERKSCCRIVVAVSNSCNYQCASFSTWSSHTFHIALWVSAVSHKRSVVTLVAVASLCDHCIWTGVLKGDWSNP